MLTEQLAAYLNFKCSTLAGGQNENISTARLKQEFVQAWTSHHPMI